MKKRGIVSVVGLVGGGGAGWVLASYLDNRKLWNFNWDDKTSSSSSSSSSSSPGALRSRRHLILLRHGQYKNVGSKDPDVQGLTALGKSQAFLTGSRLQQILAGKDVKAIYHSNMLRAQESAEIISSFFPDVPKIEDDYLAEGVPARPVPPSSTFQPTDEEIHEGATRIETAFRNYFFRPQDGKESYHIFVIHGNVIRFFFCRALQFPPQAWLRLATYNCGITWLTIDEKGRTSCREFGGIGHIPSDSVTYH